MHACQEGGQWQKAFTVFEAMRVLLKNLALQKSVTFCVMPKNPKSPEIQTFQNYI